MKCMEKSKEKINFFFKIKLLLLKLLLSFQLIFFLQFTAYAENAMNNLGNSEPLPYSTETNCSQATFKDDCRDLLDDPNAPVSSELGEAPTGY